MSDIVSLTIPQAEDISKRISVVGSIEPEELFNRISEPSSVADFVNIPVSVHGVYCTVIDIADEKTGELVKTPLLYLITADGAIVSRSKTVINAVMTFFSFMGPPNTWKAPRDIVFFTQKGKGGETFYSLKLAPKGKS